MTSEKNNEAPLLPQRAIDCLMKYFRYDTWSVKNALCLLCGINPDTAEIVWEKKDANGDLVSVMPEVYTYHPFESDEPIIGYGDDGYPVPGHNPLMPEGDFMKLLDAQERLRDLKKLWDSKLDEKTDYSPSTYIQWALGKDHGILWLDWAENNGYWDEREDSNDPIKASATSDDDDKKIGKSRKPLLRTIAGLLKVGFPDLDPNDKTRLTGRKGLHRDFELAQVYIDKDVLSRYLKEAVALNNEDIADMEEKLGQG